MTRPVDLPGLRRNAVIAASAGTGKTELLTSIALAHMLGIAPGGPVAPERIAATTFSRLAAQEIRERLERRLGRLASANTEAQLQRADPGFAAVARDGNLRPSELAARAGQALSELPRTLIDTLHGLAARVIRTYSFELELRSELAILDEQQAFEDAENTVEDVLSRALLGGGAGAEASTQLVDLAGGLEATRAAVISFLALLDEEGLDADALRTPDPTVETAALQVAFSTAAKALLQSEPEPTLAAPARRALSALAKEPKDLDALELAFRELLEQKAWNRIARLGSGPQFADALTPLLRGTSKQKRLHASIEYLRQAEPLAKQCQELGILIGTIQRTIRSRRIQSGALGFGDLLRIVRDGLRDRPDLAAQAAGEFDLLLVDEFQDTSRVQRDLILLLRERPEARMRRQPGQLPAAGAIAPHGLLVVGDRKQSIYGFRGADVSVFTEFLAELAGEPAASALGLQGVSPNPSPVADFVSLGTNFRSGTQILDFVNAISRLDFARAPEHAFEIKYSDAEELVAPSADRPKGRVVLLEDDEAVPAEADALIANSEGALRAALIVAGYCADAFRSGTELSEIAVLSRRRSSLPLVELAFDRLQIPFVVSGRALYATPEVRDVALLLRLSLDPYNRHALAAIARGPWGGLSDRTLTELCRPGRGLLPARAWQFGSISDPMERARAEQLATQLVDLEITLPLLSPRDAIAHAVARFELDAVLAALPRGAVRFGNVGRLLEIAATHGGSLPIFVRWLDRQIALDTDESEAAVFSEADQAVRLLTIHASKGLSFPITVLVDVDAIELARSSPLGLLRSGATLPELVVRHRGAEGPVSTPTLLRAQQEGQARARAERQRLSYVALTRAERELVLALPSRPRPGSLAASVFEFLESDPPPELRVVRLNARDLLASPAVVPRQPALPSPPPPRPARNPVSTLAVGATALADFILCPRRFSLIHVYGVEEPQRGIEKNPQSESALQLGTAAHRVLERFPLEDWGLPVSLERLIDQLAREGLDRSHEQTHRTAEGIRRFLQSDYAARVRTRSARVDRELELNLVVTLPEALPQGSQLELFAPGGRTTRALVKATLDLVVSYPDGAVEVIDYKRARGEKGGIKGQELHRIQLSTYSQAVARALNAQKIRTGLVHLLGDSPGPEWITTRPTALAESLAGLVERRYSGEYPPVALARCQLARCGFLPVCHPG